MLKITVQRATRKSPAPAAIELRRWAKKTLQDQNLSSAEVHIRIVGEEEMTELNSRYRKKTGTTNVLSFPYEHLAYDDSQIPALGDLVICAAVVNAEAKTQKKTVASHWAQMVVHGILHLLGFDHVKDDEADQMEALEIKTLQSLGFENPYDTQHR